MQIKEREDGLIITHASYTATLSCEGGRIVSFVHAGAGSEFAGGRGLAEELECGHPGQMGHDPYRQELLATGEREVKVRYTYQGRPGFFFRWAMTYVKTYTFSAGSPLITVEQTVRNAGAPELFGEFRLHHEVRPDDGRVMLVPTTAGMQEIAAVEAGAHFITDFTAALAAVWRRDTREALLLLPDYDHVAKFLFSTGKNLATVEWYCRSFTLADNARWTTAYRLLPALLDTPADLPAALAAAGLNVDLGRRERRPQAPVAMYSATADLQERTAALQNFSSRAARLAAREAAFATPAVKAPVVLPDGTACSQAILTQPGAGFEVTLPEADGMVVTAEAVRREVGGPGETEAFLGCCDPQGNLHAVSQPVTLSFWNATATVRLPLDDLAGKSVRLFLFGPNVFWTSLALTSTTGNQVLFAALRVWTEGAGEPAEIGPDGRCPLVIAAASRDGAPLLEFGPDRPGVGRKAMERVPMQRVAGNEHRFSAQVSVPANQRLRYRVTAGTSAVTGRTCRFGYPAAAGLPEGAVCFYVSSVGNDAHSGALPDPDACGTDGPFATFARAQAAVRKLRRHGRLPKPVAVLVRGGTYELAEPLTFIPDDSGTAACPVLFAAYPGETVVLSGGRKITAPWQPQADGIWSCRLPAGQPLFRQLFVNGKRALRARLPQDGFYHMGLAADAERKTFFFAPDDLRGQAGLTNGELVAYFVWNETRYGIRGVDTSRNALTVTAPVSPSRTLDRYYVENIPGGLVTPGAWCFDPDQGALLWHPEPGTAPDTAAVVVPVLPELARFQGRDGAPVRHIALRGFTFAHAEWSERDGGSQAAAKIGSAVSFEHAESCCARDCRVLNVGTYGVGLYGGCRHVTVAGCEIAYAGAGGIRVGLTVQDETTGHNAVLGNDVHDCGEVYPSAVGIWIGQSSDNCVLRNHVHHLPYTGISVGWTWGPAANTHKRNRIEYNTLHDLMQVLEDGGAIYLLGVSYGTTVRHNVIHHVHHGNGIYPDEGSTGIHFCGNLIYRCGWGFGLHGARDNLFEHNIVANTHEHLLGLSNCQSYMGDNRFRQNVFYAVPARPFVKAWGWTRRFVVESGGNLFFCGERKPFVVDSVPGMTTLDDWIAAGYETASVREDPCFVDPEHDDYRFRPESPVLRLHPDWGRPPCVTATRKNQ